MRLRCILIYRVGGPVVLFGIEGLLVDLCTACGHVQRLYVKNPNHRWLT